MDILLLALLLSIGIFVLNGRQQRQRIGLAGIAGAVIVQGQDGVHAASIVSPVWWIRFDID